MTSMISRSTTALAVACASLGLFSPIAAHAETATMPTLQASAATVGTGEGVSVDLVLPAAPASTATLSFAGRVLTLPAAYVELERRPQPVGRPRTWVRFTARGRRAYRGHVAALKAIVGD